MKLDTPTEAYFNGYNDGEAHGIEAVVSRIRRFVPKGSSIVIDLALKCYEED